MKKTILSLAFILFPVIVEGATLKTQGVPTQKFAEKVTVHPEAQVVWEGAPKLPKLKLTGAGIRKKKIAFVSLDVYVASSYLDEAISLNANDPMLAIRQTKVKAIQLTFLRDLSSDKIRSSFTAALKKNEVDLEAAPIKKAISLLDFDVKEGEVLTLLGYVKNPGTEVLVFETPKGPRVIEGPEVASLFWLIWFGVPEDSGLETLKEQLVGKSQP